MLQPTFSVVSDAVWRDFRWFFPALKKPVYKKWLRKGRLCGFSGPCCPIWGVGELQERLEIGAFNAPRGDGRRPCCPIQAEEGEQALASPDYARQA